MSIPKVLAVDYGTVRIGLAVSAHTLADPLAVIKNDAQAVETIAQLCHENSIELLLLGISEREMAEKTKQFALKLKNYITVPLEFVDETLSSYTVHQKLKTAKKKKRSGEIDHYAAAEFLQTWLDEYQE